MKLTVVLSGGAMGDDPYDPASWSGSSLNLINALDARGALAGAYGISLPKWQFALQAAPRFSPDREVWRRRVYRSRSFRQALTSVWARRAAHEAQGDVILQLGAYADGPSVYAGRGVPVLTYQDGSAAAYDENPYVPEALRRETALQAEALAFEKQVAQGAARVLTTSDWLKGHMIRSFDLGADHVATVGCGTARPVTATPGDHDYTRPVLLFVGVTWAQKGGPALLEAFAKVRHAFPEAQLHIVGPREQPPGTDAPGVTWHGFLRRDNEAEAATLTGLFRSSSLFVLPSRNEAFGIAPIEAMSNGLPAVVTGEWALAENVRDGIDGAHVPIDNPVALAGTLTRLLGNPKKLAEMGRAAASTPARQSWDDVVSNILAVAEEALA